MIDTKETPASVRQHMTLLDEMLSENPNGTFDVQAARAAIESSVDLMDRLADQIEVPGSEVPGSEVPGSEVPGSEVDVAPNHECTARLCQPGLELRIHGMECNVCFETVAWPELPFHYNEHFDLVTWAELSAKNSAMG